MKKKIISSLIILIFMLSMNSAVAIQLKNTTNDPDYTFTLSVNKNFLGYVLKTEIINTGGEGYLLFGDIGCEIYDEEDNLVWTSYENEGPETGIGKDAKITTTNVWTGEDINGNNVEKGTYKIIGKAAYYYDNNNFKTIETEPEFLEIEQAKSKSFFFNFLVNILNKIF